jgi:hypothetical protein
MTMVCSTFILIAQKEGFGLPHITAYSIGGIITLATTIGFFVWKNQHKNNFNNDNE